MLSFEQKGVQHNLAIIELKNLTKSYTEEKIVVENINLTIEPEEFVVFLGPSGCGKSTILRMIAGLETITSGELYMKEVRQNDLPAQKRNIAMVFQNYALYPHMTVFQNISFGLTVRGVQKKLSKRKSLRQRNY